MAETDKFEMFLRDNGGKLIYDEFLDECGYKFDDINRGGYHFVYKNAGDALLIYYVRENIPPPHKEKYLGYWGNIPKTMQAMEILFFDLMEITKRRRLLIEKIK